MTQQADMTVRPAAAVREFRPYRVPRPEARIDLYLDANEGPSAAGDLARALGDVDPERIRRYPDKGRLEELIAGRFGLGPECVIVTGGADDALERCCRAVLEPGRELILPGPTFEMIARAAKLAGGSIIEPRWFDEPFPTSGVLESITERTAAIALVSPNNPTGAVIPIDAIRTIAEVAPRALLMVDLAYVEFADEDLTAAVLELPNAVVIRTLSKACGLAGLRIGYALGDARIIDWLRSVGGPYPVSGPALALAEARLEQDDGVDRTYLTRIRFEREALAQLLTAFGAMPLPSQANFILSRFEDALAVRDALGAFGIAVRAFPDHPELADRLRITCPGHPETFDRLVGALKSTLQFAARKERTAP